MTPGFPVNEKTLLAVQRLVSQLKEWEQASFERSQDQTIKLEEQAYHLGKKDAYAVLIGVVSRASSMSDANANLVRCASCKWWSRPCGDVPTHRCCEHPKCQSETPDGFGSQDGEPYNGGRFATGPEFGCVYGDHA